MIKKGNNKRVIVPESRQWGGGGGCRSGLQVEEEEQDLIWRASVGRKRDGRLDRAGGVGLAGFDGLLKFRFWQGFPQ
jgi:hypothetical protein